MNIQFNTERCIRITEQAADVDVTSFNLEQRRSKSLPGAAMGKGLHGGLGQSHAEPEAAPPSTGLQPSWDQGPTSFPRETLLRNCQSFWSDKRQHRARPDKQVLRASSQSWDIHLASFQARPLALWSHLEKSINSTERLFLHSLHLSNLVTALCGPSPSTAGPHPSTWGLFTASSHLQRQPQHQY